MSPDDIEFNAQTAAHFYITLIKQNIITIEQALQQIRTAKTENADHADHAEQMRRIGLKVMAYKTATEQSA